MWLVQIREVFGIKPVHQSRLGSDRRETLIFFVIQANRKTSHFQKCWMKNLVILNKQCCSRSKFRVVQHRPSCFFLLKTSLQELCNMTLMCSINLAGWRGRHAPVFSSVALTLCWNRLLQVVQVGGRRCSCRRAVSLLSSRGVGVLSLQLCVHKQRQEGRLSGCWTTEFSPWKTVHFSPFL